LGPGVVFLYEEQLQFTTMNKILCLAAALLALNLAPVFGQPGAPLPLQTPGGPRPPTFEQRLSAIRGATLEANPAPALTKFSLDFPGGTPAQLAQAIEKALDKPLNVIIPAENADLTLPPLKLNDVVVPQLFKALAAASRKTVDSPQRVYPGYPGGTFSQYTTDYGFRTADDPVTDASIWYFYVDKPTLPPVIAPEKDCRFFSLALYLNRGYTVDDITTAIQTGWKLAGNTNPPELNYHKETKLLIAYGEPGKLSIIDQVLNSLPGINVSWQDYHKLQDDLAGAQAELKSLEHRLNAAPQTNSMPAPEVKAGN
jgi:hypothetical protein